MKAGDHRDEDWTRTPYTCAAVLGEDGRPVKLDAPLFGPRDDHSEHQRDPKVVYNADNQTYYIFIGAQTLDKRGCVMVYRSKELLKGWEYAGQLNVPGYEAFAGMWECPYITSIGGQDVLIFSPQYTKLPGRGESTNHNVYLIGKMDYDALTFTPDGPYRYLDYGFDFYAAQGAFISRADGGADKGILIGWIGLPDNHYPTEEEDWEGSLSLPRELRIVDGKLKQTPIPAALALRGKEIEASGALPAACYMEVSCPEGDFDLNLYTKADGSGGLRMRCDAARRVVTVDKRGLDKRFNQAVGEVLEMPLEAPLEKLQIFIDRSSTEIFVGDGEAVFTAHTYPTEGEFHYAAGPGVGVRLWEMHKSVTDEFVV